MKQDKIKEKDAIIKLKALGLSEEEAIGTINVRLEALNVKRKRQAIDVIIAQIKEEE